MYKFVNKLNKIGVVFEFDNLLRVKLIFFYKIDFLMICE